MAPFPVSPAAASMNLIRRPLRDLLCQLPSLPVTASGEPDYAEADPDLLVGFAESAELALQIVHGGFSAIGLLQASTVRQIEGGEVSATHAAALGRLLVELGEMLLHVHVLSVECRRYTADYVPDCSGRTDQSLPGAHET
ncbi:hypothetical protein GXB81_03765 [Paraburkholderia sp. Ac-20336]|uniref:hypothetical protein n=1 Tax=Paraburkholderia sp. Ac-20336 TaxID=2703886 RepID=UPI001981AFAD|nr:hypothetical protein [Paraburkholderia sp. Ac-20336]MBN3802173.1 hypothetical protein [Paraburkholderia sp. Ac-20336]